MTLSDRVVDHLRNIIDEPDFSGTRYRIIEAIGRGGMGTVYLAHDSVLDRNVAVKVLSAGCEARTLAALEHPGIVPVHDAGALPDGRSFYAMKMVAGARLDEYRANPHSLADRLRIFIRICEPVAFAHARGVAHRDLKPANIMLGSFGEVLVLDWGAAWSLDQPVDCAAGTEGYMAPEQTRGIISAQTDIYSLGKVLEFLIGPQDSNRVRAIAAKASDPDAGRRYAGVTGLAGDVTRFLDGEPVDAYRESVWERMSRWISNNRALVILAATYLVVRAVIFFLFRH